MQIEDFYYTDPTYLQKLDVEIIPPIPFNQVIAWMGKAVFNPVIYRPLFSHLQLVTCRTFETPAASTIPLFGLDIAYVQEMYGERATELVLLDDDHPEEKIADIMRRPEYYAEIVLDMRRHLTQKHSYAVRLQELIELVKT